MPCCRCFSSERGSSFSYMERRWSISIGNRGVGMKKCLVEKHQNTSKRIKTDQNASKSIKTDQNASKSIKTHQTYQKVTAQCCGDNMPHRIGLTNLPKMKGTRPHIPIHSGGSWISIGNHRSHHHLNCRKDAV